TEKAAIPAGTGGAGAAGTTGKAGGGGVSGGAGVGTGGAGGAKAGAGGATGGAGGAKAGAGGATGGTGGAKAGAGGTGGAKAGAGGAGGAKAGAGGATGGAGGAKAGAGGGDSGAGGAKAGAGGGDSGAGGAKAGAGGGDSGAGGAKAGAGGGDSGAGGAKAGAGGGDSGAGGAGGDSGAGGAGGDSGAGGGTGGAGASGTFQGLSAYYAKTCAHNAGSLYCWGTNTNGEVGDGTVSDAEPSPRQTLGTEWAKVSAGGKHTCGIELDKALLCWGGNGEGELGRGGVVSPLPAPSQVEGGGKWIDVSAGDLWTCAIKDDFSLWCWGKFPTGDWGDGNSRKTVPFAIGTDTDWVEVGLGRGAACARKENGDVYCLGNNVFGNLGDGTGAASNVPVKVLLPGAATQLSVGYGHACALVGNLPYCWGSDADDQLGLGVSGNQMQPVAAHPDAQWSYVSAGGRTTCGIRVDDDTLWCWGSRWHGLLGDGQEHAFDQKSEAPVQIGVAGQHWVAVRPGMDHACAIDSVSKLTCWGRNDDGQLGIGVKTAVEPPQVVQ
ncbi:MAG: hypothetical protein IT374_01525, partial [Polyangiaceae bacterium]|nr:hypothetical protein [Polyangiaceae bacterium]